MPRSGALSFAILDCGWFAVPVGKRIPMTTDQFLRIIRGDGDKLRVDDVVIKAGDLEIRGKGTLRITGDKFEAEVAIENPEQLPEMRSGIYTKRDSWTMLGVIENQLSFRCDHVGPVAPRSVSWPPGTTRCRFHLNPLELVPVGFDAMSRKEKREFRKQHDPTIADPVDLAEDEKQDVGFYATLREYPWLSSKQGTEFVGETGFFNFKLEKEENDDVRVSLESKPSYASLGSDGDWTAFHAFMNALALVTGTHAWPYRVSYWVAGQKKTERIMPAGKLTGTSHAPFDRKLAFAALTGQQQWDLGTALSNAAIFFEQDSALSREVSQILFLFRQADAGVQSEITTIAFCVLFENLIQVLFAELHLDSSMKPMVDSFNAAKADLCNYIEGRLPKIPSSGDGYARMLAITKSAEPFSMRQKFGAVVAHFCLTWDGDMEKVWRSWSKTRHPLVHANRRGDDSEDDLKNAVLAESRLAGAINVITLKLIGYSGLMKESVFEERYRKI
jgi:hypothetical protein